MIDFFFSEEHCLCRSAAAMVGLLWMGVTLWRCLGDFLSGLWAYFLSLRLGMGQLDFTKYGSWAVVTGASEGIGRGYAHELARRGLNVVLMSRSREKLQKVADEIKEAYKKEVLVIPVDFSSSDNVYDRLSQQLKGLDIAVLVNNVGMYYEMPDIVANIPPQRLFDVARVNTHPVIQMSKLVLPDMLKKRKGVIVNMSSSASIIPAPQMTVYSATKIFTNYVSDGLRKEHGANGILVQNVIPFLVATSMSGVRRGTFFIPDSMNYARAAVATIGIQDNTTGCFAHAILGYVGSWMPEFLWDYLARKYLNEGREKYLRRKAKSK